MNLTKALTSLRERYAAFIYLFLFFFSGCIYLQLPSVSLFSSHKTVLDIQTIWMKPQTI